MNDLVKQLDATVRRGVAWLDTANGRGQGEITHRILKIVEELGEASQAWIGVTGQNPRKGLVGTVDDVAMELCDVIITALVAMASLPRSGSVDWQTRLNGRANELECRIRMMQEKYDAETESYNAVE